MINPVTMPVAGAAAVGCSALLDGFFIVCLFKFLQLFFCEWKSAYLCWREPPTLRLLWVKTCHRVGLSLLVFSLRLRACWLLLLADALDFVGLLKKLGSLLSELFWCFVHKSRSVMFCADSQRHQPEAEYADTAQHPDTRGNLLKDGFIMAGHLIHKGHAANEHHADGGDKDEGLIIFHNWSYCWHGWLGQHGPGQHVFGRLLKNLRVISDGVPVAGVFFRMRKRSIGNLTIINHLTNLCWFVRPLLFAIKPKKISHSAKPSNEKS